VSVALAAGSLAALPAYAEVTITPSIMVSGTYADNFALASEGAEQEDVIWQANPSIVIQHRAQRANSSLLYTMQNVFYTDENDLNETFHQLDAGSQIQVLRDLFTLDLAAGISQAVIDPEQPRNPNNLFASGNIADATRYSARPHLTHRFGSVQADAEYLWGRVDYEPVRDGDPFVSEDADDTALVLSLASADPEARLTWRLSYEERETDYKTALDYAYDVAALDLGWGLTRKLRLLVRGGVESDLLVRQDQGGLDEGFWEVGFRWRPTSLNELEVRGGRRSFGDSWSALYRRRARQLQLELTYSVVPTTQSQALIFADPVLPPDQTPGPSGPLEPLPVGPDLRLTDEVYISRNLAGTLNLTGRRGAVALRLFGEEREYIASNLIEKSNGFSFAYSRRMTSLIDAGIDVIGQRTELRADAEFDEGEARLWARTRIGMRSALTLTAARRERSGDGAQEFTLHTVTLAWNREF
jgi:uncharacterized protein (PEP-CTERM system associated)